VTERELEAILAQGHETQGVEFKGRGKRTNSAFLAPVIRAMLGMANHRDGGHVILGIDSESLEPIGLDDDQEASWLDHDALASAVNEYASPSVSFEVQRLTFQENKIVIIRVEEFAEIPILCKKDFHTPGKKPPVLRRGACYVRARHKPETSEIPSEQEMRELLGLAIDKGVVKFLARAQKLGLFLAIAGPPLTEGDLSRFQKQLEEME
jgi:predicted HTH transcriptional regulator